MELHVGPHVYTAKITPGPLVIEGVEAEGACLQSSREILIGADVPPAERMRVLLRELARGWAFDVGIGDAWCDVAATMAIAAIRDLNAQGGELAVLALRPGETTSAATAKIGLSTNRYCPCCQETVAGGSVDWHPAHVPGVVDVAIFCPFCGDTWRWREAQSTRGLPTNIVLSAPVKERGDTISRQHAGV